MKDRRYIVSLAAAVLLLTTSGCGAQADKETVIFPVNISLATENIDTVKEASEAESTEEQDELFNWDGVYIEMLAEHDETLSEETRA